MGIAVTNRATTGRRAHVHELDRLRIETALSVVIVHVLMFTTFVEHSLMGVQAQEGFVAIFHYTRELFMFVTGLALVYVYYGKPFDWRYFWKRRGIGVLLPYLLWSVVYTVVNNPGRTWQWLAGASAFGIVTGSASYQLYYILMTLQFYLLLPVFLWFLRRVHGRPWWVLGISFVLQVALLTASFRYITGPTAAHTAVIAAIGTYQERCAVLYQFYFILGGLAALYLDHVRAFLARRGWWLLLLGGFAFAVNLAVYLYYVFARHVPPTTATTAFQPVMVLYATGLIVTLGYLAFCSVRRSPAGDDPRQPRSRWWALLSDASFGIYLVHALVLTYAQRYVVPIMSGMSPWVVLLVLCIVTCLVSIVATVVFMRTPILRRTIGRERPAATMRSTRLSADDTSSRMGQVA